MDSVSLSDVQLANLTMLLTIKESIKHDGAAACCKFGLQADELKAIADLSPERMLEVVTSFGHESLFPPRDDLGKLLNSPLALAAIMASARPKKRRFDALRSGRNPTTLC